MKLRLNIYRGLLLSGLLIAATSCSDSFLDLSNQIRSQIIHSGSLKVML